jgi:DNA adenine methylase
MRRKPCNARRLSLSGTRVWYTSAPFLKWPGGKRWLATRAIEISPTTFGRYYEPFVGSGAMFFALRPQAAVLSDMSEELINCYQQIQEDWSTIWAGLVDHAGRHSEALYYEVRARELRESRDRAIRFLYLNRASFNGIYRVNRFGKFNVPKGSKTVLVYPFDNFREVSEAIAAVDFRCSDFEALIEEAREGDFIFCDPPYSVTHSRNGFIKYNDRLFSWSDQVRLRDALVRAHKRRVFALLSNADFPGIRELYKVQGFRCTPLSRRSAISAKAAARGTYGEVLISNYPFQIYGRE